MLSIFRANPLDQAYNVKKYQELLTKTYKEILISEIESNTHSYNGNKLITEKANRNYTKGVKITTIALLISIILLFANQFIKIEKTPTKVQVVNIKKTQENSSTNDTINAGSIFATPISPPN